MNRSEMVLAALAASNGGVHTPVQVQKLFFLIDMNLPTVVNGPHFSFLPKDYGPFDKEVYSQLEQLAATGDVEVIEGRLKSYRLSPKGQQLGEQALANLHPSISDYLRDLSAWIRSLSFADLVSAIYKMHPDMRVNSVFRNY
jgi:uncharacterized protein YwgA